MSFKRTSQEPEANHQTTGRGRSIAGRTGHKLSRQGKKKSLSLRLKPFIVNTDHRQGKVVEATKVSSGSVISSIPKSKSSDFTKKSE
jgi:hypothetical protein